MSSSSNNLNPFAYFTSSTSYQNPVSVSVPFPFPPLYSHEPESFFTQPNYLYPFSLTPPFLTANCPSVLPGPFIPPNDSTMAKQDVNISSGATSGSSLAKKPVKKDRLRKIYTAQGLRDRRVRLSVEISRKFFDLQDMLGYDKASKTLEWLLSKSRRAIKELVKTKNSWCAAENRADSVGNFGWKKIDQSISEKKFRKVGLPDLLAKESRAKARARARKRTIEKMITVNQIRPLNQLEPSKMFFKEVIAEAQTPEISQADRQNMAGKSALIKTKMKPFLLPGSNFPVEESINNNNIFANFPGNLEINVPFSQYTLYTTSYSNL